MSLSQEYGEAQRRGRTASPAKPRRVPAPAVSAEDLAAMLVGSARLPGSPSPALVNLSPAPSTVEVPGSPRTHRLRGPRAPQTSPRRKPITDLPSEPETDSHGVGSSDVFGDRAPASPSSRFRTPGPILPSGPPAQIQSRPASPQKSPQRLFASPHLAGSQLSVHAPRPEYPKQQPYLASHAFDVSVTPVPTQPHGGVEPGTPVRRGTYPAAACDVRSSQFPQRGADIQTRVPSPTKRAPVATYTLQASTHRDPSPTRPRIKVQVEASQGMGLTYQQKLSAAQEAMAAAYQWWSAAGYPEQGRAALAYAAAVEREEQAQNELDIHNARTAAFQASYD